jgi:hypothetical protein
MRCKRGPAKGPGSLSLTRLPALPPSIGMLLLCLALAFLTLFGDSPPFRISHVMCEVSEICCHFLFIPYVACCLLHIASRMPPGPSAHVRCPCWPRTCHRAMSTGSNQPGATPEDRGANNFQHHNACDVPSDPILFRLLHGTRPPPPIASIPVCIAHACTRSLTRDPTQLFLAAFSTVHLRRRDASMSHAPVAQAWTARPALVHSATRLTSLAHLGLKPREQLSLAGRTLHLTLWWGLGACHTHHFARGLLCIRSTSHTCGRISRGPCACAYH